MWGLNLQSLKSLEVMITYRSQIKDDPVSHKLETMVAYSQRPTTKPPRVGPVRGLERSELGGLVLEETVQTRSLVHGSY